MVEKKRPQAPEPSNFSDDEDSTPLTPTEQLAEAAFSIADALSAPSAEKVWLSTYLIALKSETYAMAPMAPDDTFSGEHSRAAASADLSLQLYAKRFLRPTESNPSNPADAPSGTASTLPAPPGPDEEPSKPLNIPKRDLKGGM